jgi:hypothetical protein
MARHPNTGRQRASNAFPAGTVFAWIDGVRRTPYDCSADVSNSVPTGSVGSGEYRGDEYIRRGAGRTVADLAIADLHDTLRAIRAANEVDSDERQSQRAD